MPSAMIALTIACAEGSLSITAVKLQSIFSLSNGKVCRLLSEECPVPKSSITIRTP
ncbi:hypothetical protein D3C87_1920340 [compost metagenome]